MEGKTTKYIRCRNCGCHIEENQSISKLYCSEQCAKTFTRCSNCGIFFSSTKKDLHNGFCSIECEAVYSEDGIIITKDNEHVLKEEQK